MSHHYAVIGAGRQGLAAAYDLALYGEASCVTLMDSNEKAAQSASVRINRLVGRQIAQGRKLDVREQKAVKAALEGIDGFISAVPYYYNFELSKAAIRTKAHMADMGGNEKVVAEQLALNDEALQAGVCIIPDCGMGPGMTGSLAAYGIGLMDKAEEAFIWDGGLPLNPKPPWNFQLTFHINGLTNEYHGEATFLREGRVVKVPTFSEYELIDFPPLGQLEAFVTAGGTSSAIKTYQGQLCTYQNKTLRYPGHLEQFRAYKLLGLFEEKPISFAGGKVVPRDFFHALLEPKILPDPDYKDICLIKVVVRGMKNKKPSEFTAQLIDRFDEKTGFTSMQRLTGWHAAIMLEMATQGRSKKGVHGLEVAVSPVEFIAEVKKRGLDIKERFSSF